MQSKKPGSAHAQTPQVAPSAIGLGRRPLVGWETGLRSFTNVFLFEDFFLFKEQKYWFFLDVTSCLMILKSFFFFGLFMTFCMHVLLFVFVCVDCFMLVALSLAASWMMILDVPKHCRICLSHVLITALFVTLSQISEYLCLLVVLECCVCHDLKTTRCTELSNVVVRTCKEQSSEKSSKNRNHESLNAVKSSNHVGVPTSGPHIVLN